MKQRLFTVVLMLCLVSRADVVIDHRRPYIVLGRGLTWGTGTNDTFVFTPFDPNQGVCIFVTNNASTSRSFTMRVFRSGDPSVSQYTGQEGRFIEETVQGTVSPVAANSTTSGYAHTVAASRVAVQISGSSPNGGTADIFVVQTSARGCGSTGTSGGVVTVQGSRALPLTQASTNADLLVSTRAFVVCGSGPIPTTSTAVLTTTVRLSTLVVSNPTASQITFTLQDRQATPLTLFGNIPVNGNSTILFKPETIELNNGFQWSASAAGLNGFYCYVNSGT